VVSDPMPIDYRSVTRYTYTPRSRCGGCSTTRSTA
jgi:hypothetical protein